MASSPAWSLSMIVAPLTIWVCEPDSVADLEVTKLCLAVLVDVAGRSDAIGGRPAACLDRHRIAANRSDGSAGPGQVITATRVEVRGGCGGAACRLPTAGRASMRRSRPQRLRSPLRRRRRRGCPHRSPGRAGDRAGATGRSVAGKATCSCRSFLGRLNLLGHLPFLSTYLGSLCREPAGLLVQSDRSRPKGAGWCQLEAAGTGRGRDSGQWDLDPEAATGPRTGFDVHRPAVPGHERSDDGQAQPGPAVATAGLVGAVEPFEDSRCFAPASCRGPRQRPPGPHCPGRLLVNPAGDPDRDRCPRRRVPQRVSDQVGYDLPQAGSRHR